jgi:DNA polymerase I-like protein with 3'-5' exonuclease and polymerase domains
MAGRYFGDRWEQASPAERKQLRGWSKRITYGTNYGMGVAALARSLDVSEREARAWMYAKDRAFPAVTRTRAEAQSEARRTNRLRLWTGRPIAVPSAFVAWNYLCQGGG